MTPRCPRCNQFLPLLGVHRCPCWEYNREPQSTRIGHWATWLVASSLAFVVLLAVAANATPRTALKPSADPHSAGVPSSVVAPQGSSGQLGASLGPLSETASPVDALERRPTPFLPAVASLPVAEPIRTSAPVPTPPETDTAEGWATWCGPTATQCQSWGPPAMLGAVPSFRWGDEPYRVRISRGEASVVVTVVSFCACRDRHGLPTLVDLSPAAFKQLGPLSRGVLRVEVEVLP